MGGRAYLEQMRTCPRNPCIRGHVDGVKGKKCTNDPPIGSQLWLDDRTNAASWVGADDVEVPQGCDEGDDCVVFMLYLCCVCV